MASPPPLTIPVDRMIKSDWRGGREGGWRHDCGTVSCTSKVMKVLTGSLATTTGSRSSYSCSSFGFPDFRVGLEAPCFGSSEMKFEGKEKFDYDFGELGFVDVLVASLLEGVRDWELDWLHEELLVVGYCYLTVEPVKDAEV
ncbi:hypothetical protein Droror1_Dr00018506 [Drosera rotundifolia]